MTTTVSCSVQEPLDQQLCSISTVCFGFAAEQWACFLFSLQLDTCHTRAAHLNVPPTSIQ